MIIFRYLTREVFLTFFAVTFVLLLIFLSNQFVHYLSTAAMGRLSSHLLFSLITLEVPYLLGLLMPLGFFLAILLAYGRLYVDGEMGALIACGLGKIDLIKITCLMAAFVALVVGCLVLWCNPKLLAYRNQLLAKADTRTLLGALLPCRFQQLPGNHGRVFYVENMSRDKKQLQNVFLAEQPPSSDKSLKPSVLFAQSGYQMHDPTTHHLFLVLNQGYWYAGIPGEKEYRIIHFDHLGLRLDKQVRQFVPLEQQSMPTWTLWQTHADRNKNLAELEWRMAMPISVGLLALLAVSLSEVKPRQGRYAKLIPAVLIYTVYANLLFVSRSWVERGVISPEMGMWWVHALLALLTALLIYLSLFRVEVKPFFSRWMTYIR